LAGGTAATWSVRFTGDGRRIGSLSAFVKSDDRTTASGGRSRTPPTPDTPELAEQRAQAPTAQAMIKATRRLLAEGGLEWASDQRIHAATPHPKLGRRTGRPPGTMRYYFASRERLLVQVARFEHLQRLDQVRRALRAVATTEELTAALLRLIDAPEHYRVIHALLQASAAMPELADHQQRLWADWRGRMREIVIDLQHRGIVSADHDPEALALVWSAVTLGLADHREAEPKLDLRSVYRLLQQYADRLH
jgi:AcrR family transcriptional regulator